jgi:hypothetical protein
MVKFSDTSLRRILHDHLGMHKVSTRWIPKHLSAVQRQHRVECARILLKLCGSDPKAVLETIVTGVSGQLIILRQYLLLINLSRGL